MQSVSELRDKVRGAYSAAAESPKDKHPFPVGRAFAESVGYPDELLNELPSIAAEGFAGVSNVSLFADITEGATVLDLGCGAGLDSLMASRRVGKTGHVLGVDFSDAMLQRAQEAAIQAGTQNLTFERGDAEGLPAPSESFDVAIVNGIFNLNPARESIFRELARVLRPNGVLYAAELILSSALPAEVKQTEADWFA